MNVDDQDLETNEELERRYKVVKAEYEKAVAQMNKMKMGPARTRKAMWAGCLSFTYGYVKDKMIERGLITDPYGS